MRHWLRLWLTSERLGVGSRLAIGMAFATLAIWIRLSIHGLVGEAIPFLTFFPAILIASALTGWVGGLACLALCVVYGLYFFLPLSGEPDRDAGAWIAASMLAAAGGLIALVSVQLRNALLEVQRAREKEQLLVLEVQHRTKNTLAIVQSLATQSLRTARDGASFKRDFTERLVALGEAHNLLSERAWGSVSLGQLAERSFAAFAGTGDGRIELSGPEILLPPGLAVEFGLCFHELGTNATKYGALSTEAGRAELRWSAAPAPGGLRVELLWRERGGPPVAKPRRTGLGVRLLAQCAAGARNRSVELSFDPQGVVWSFGLDLSSDPAPAPTAAPPWAF